MTEPHRTEVVARPDWGYGHDFSPHYVATCSTCGWLSQMHRTKADAEDDGDGHTLAMAGVEDHR